MNAAVQLKRLKGGRLLTFWTVGDLKTCSVWTRACQDLPITKVPSVKNKQRCGLLQFRRLGWHSLGSLNRQISMTKARIQALVFTKHSQIGAKIARVASYEIREGSFTRSGQNLYGRASSQQQIDLCRRSSKVRKRNVFLHKVSMRSLGVSAEVRWKAVPRITSRFWRTTSLQHPSAAQSGKAGLILTEVSLNRLWS